jgi:Domain of unknown function (DUF4112)
MSTPEAEYIPRGEPPQGLEHLKSLAYLLDRAFRIPGTSWRFGLDALIGLFPGLGDAVGALLGIYSLWVARQIGAPGILQVRMVLNLALDGIVGLVPIAGDLFDFVFKAHSRNQALLEQWLKSPHTTRRSSWMVVAGCVLALLVLLGGAVWLLVSTVLWVVALFQA